MAYKIAIDTGNAAFDDGNATYEVARILRGLADRLEGSSSLPDNVKLYDVNGNNVGEAKATR